MIFKQLIVSLLFAITSHSLFAQWEHLGVTQGGQVTDFLKTDDTFYAITGYNDKTLYEYVNDEWIIDRYDIREIAEKQDTLFFTQQRTVFNATTGEEFEVRDKFINNLQSDNENLYAADEDSLYRSSDSGKSWEAIQVSNPFFSMLVTEDNIWIIDENGTILKSSDQGETWDSLTTLSETAQVNVFKQIEGRLYLSLNGIGLLYSDNYGASFNFVDGLSRFDAYIFGVVSYDGKVYAAGSREVYASEDLSFWYETNIPHSSFPRSLGTDGNEIFVGTNNGVFALDAESDFGWRAKMEGEMFQGVQGFTIHRDTLYTTGWQGAYYASFNGLDWEKRLINETYRSFRYINSIGDSLVMSNLYTKDQKSWALLGGSLSIRTMGYSNGTFYAFPIVNLSQNPDSRNLHRLESSGEWITINEVSENEFITSFDLQGDTIMFSSFTRVEISFDRGDNWESLSIPEGAVPSQCLIMGADLFILNGSEILRSSDMGDTWEILPISFRFSRTIQKFNDALITSNTNGNLWVSTDRGNTWVNKIGNLPGGNFNRYAVYKDYLYAGSPGSTTDSDMGIFRIPANKFFGPCEADSVTTIVSICEGEAYEFGLNFLSNEGEYSATFQSSIGCDSIVNLNLQIVEPLHVNDTIFLCQGDSLLFGDNKIGITGDYLETFTSSLTGCDSIVNLNLNILAPEEIDLSREICVGDNVIFGQQTLSEEGIYTEVFQNSFGCDSTVNLSLEFFTIDPLISLERDILSVTGHSEATYQWFDCSTDRPFENANESAFEISETGSYYVEIRVNECLVTSECFTVDIILSSEKLAPLQLFPNPVSDELFFSFGSSEAPGVYEIHDLSGKVLQKGKVLSGSPVIVSELRTGIYFVSVSQSGKKYLSKFYVH